MVSPLTTSDLGSSPTDSSDSSEDEKMPILPIGIREKYGNSQLRMEWSRCYRGLWRMRENEELCDVSVKVQKKVFNAHRAILCMESSYFRQLFLWGGQTDVAVVKGMEEDVFLKLLQYMYGSFLNLKGIDGPLLLLGAHQLGLKDLISKVEEQPNTVISNENCFEYFMVSLHLGLSKLEKVAYQYFWLHFEECLYDGNRSFLLCNLPTLNTRLKKAVHLSDREILVGITKWANHEPETRAAHIPFLLTNANLDRIPFPEIEMVISDQGTEETTTSTKDVILYEAGLLCRKSQLIFEAAQIELFVATTNEFNSVTLFSFDTMGYYWREQDRLYDFGLNSLVTNCQNIVIFGSKKMRCFDTVKRSYVQQSDIFDIPTVNYGTSTIEGIIFTAGGRAKNDNLQYSKAVCEVSFAMEKVTIGNIVPGLQPVKMTSHNGNLFIFGGTSATFDKMEVSSKKLVNLAEVPVHVGLQPCLTGFGEFIFLISGSSGILCYDIQMDIWKVCEGSLPQASIVLTATTVSDVILILCAFEEIRGDYLTLFSYDPKRDVIMKLCDLPLPPLDAAMCYCSWKYLDWMKALIHI